MRGRHHEVRARPQCPSCGDPELVQDRTRRPVTPASRRKASVVGGGHRSLTPEQVLERYKHLVSPVAGVVREIRRDHRGPEFLNSYRAGANLAAPARGIEELCRGLRSEHGGKGVTATQAECSALCEALERHSGSYHGDELRVYARLCDLSEDALHPNALQLFHDRQYAERDAWNRRHSAMHWVGEPFDERAAIDWTPVWSLTGGRQKLVPTALLYYGTPGAHGLRADSNGNAAGSSLEDALLQGFYELVERDAVALWWYNRTRMPGLDLDSFGDEWIATLREVHRALHREVWMLDLTTDLGVATTVALSRRTDKPAEDIVFGFGAHLDPRIAVRRALTELNQLLPAVVEADAGGHGYGCDDPHARRWWQNATVANQPYLLPAFGVAYRGADDFVYEPTDDLHDDVCRVQETVAAHGMELMVLDQTRPDIDLPVVKVIVPGLRHFWARFAPGRLYDVPTKLGRLAAPTPYEDLNPIPIFV
jgi:ribosomal protein S12 methylthiotransferase accessory factor